MIVTEIFPSVQGEGKTVGQPAVFLRLGGCNLRCAWCDSKYTYEDGKTGNGDNEVYTVDEVLEMITGYPIHRLIVTGGEPLLQQKELGELLRKLEGYVVEIETNGSVRSEIDTEVTQFNVSPKLSGSGVEPYPLQILPSRKTTYKFVISRPEEVQEVQLYAKCYQIPSDQIWLMPEGMNKEALFEKELWLAPLAEQCGYHFTQREHIIMWGNVRGR